MRKLMSAMWRIMMFVNWRKFAWRMAFCPICARRRLLVRLDANEIAVRCSTCRAGAITLSLVSVLNRIVPDLEARKVYELSGRGPLFRYLRKRAGNFSCSEYFEHIAPGQYCGDVQNQDVQRLTFADGCFDVCTSTEVFEHVPDDLRGFSEIYRVLAGNGVFVFTVPLLAQYQTIERASLGPDGIVRHLLPAEYHLDPLRSNKPILAFRNYGRDIVDRLKQRGFRHAEIVNPPDALVWGHVRPVVVAYKDSKPE